MGYYRPDADARSQDGEVELNLQAAVPADGLAKRFTQRSPPQSYNLHTRRFGKIWREPGALPSMADNGFPRKRLMQAPVCSPLDPSSEPLGWVVADSPKRRSFPGDPTEIGASFLAALLATGDLVAKRR